MPDLPYLSLIPTVAVAAALLWLPGVVVLRAASTPVLWSIAAAPPVGVFIVVLAGWAGHLGGFRMDGRWGVLAVVAVTAVLAVAARLSDVGRRARHLREPKRKWPTVTAWALAGSAFAVAFAVVTRTPEAWPQQGDNIFHIGTTTRLLREGSAWVGDVSGYTQLPENYPIAYPGAWHVVTGLTAGWSGASAVAASHAMVLVVAGLVWPSGLTVLAWRAARTASTTSVTSTLAAFAFYGLPYHPLAWGVQWPYLLGLVLTPWTIRGAYFVADTWHVGWRSRMGSTALLAGIVGVTYLCHPSTVFLAALLVPAVVLPTLWPRVDRRTRWALTITSAVTVISMWSVRPEFMADSTWVRSAGLATALRRLSTTTGAWWPLGLATLMIALVSALLACRRRDRWWIPIALLLTLTGNSVLVLLPPEVSIVMTWPWWGDYARFAVASALPAALAVTVLLVERVLPACRRNGPKGMLGLGLIAVTLAANVLLGAWMLRLSYYPPDPLYQWVSQADRDQLARLATRIPEHAVVAADPFRGGTHLYLNRDVTLLFPTANDPEWVGGDLALIARDLVHASTDPSVCAALSRAGVEYVVAGGTPTAAAGERAASFSGFDGVQDAAGFVRVADVGPYSLWLTPRPCRPGQSTEN